MRVGGFILKRLLSLICLIMCLNSSFAIESYASFADWNIGARSLGMGRAYVGLADDASALYWNPAAVMNLKGMQTLFQMSMLYDGYSLMYGSIALPGSETGLGLEFMMLSGGDIEGRDKFNQLAPSVSDSKMAVGLSFSKKILNNLSMGLKGKFFMRSLGEASDMAVAGDLSMMYTVSETLSMGWNLTNLTGMVIGDTNDKLLSNSSIGIVHKDKDLIFTIDSRDNFSEWCFGAEWSFIKAVPLRIGFNSYELSLGGGLNLGMINLDVAYVMKEVGSSIGFSSNLCFGDSAEAAQKSKIDEYLKDAKDLMNNDYFWMAKKKFENILVLDPSRVEVVNIIDRLNKALPYIDSTLEKELATWDKLKQAKALYEENKIDEALRIMEEVQAINSLNRYVLNFTDDLRKKKNNR